MCVLCLLEGLCACFALSASKLPVCSHKTSVLRCRVLAPDGAFFSITFTQPHFRCAQASVLAGSKHT